ncbi:MAG: DUF4209 domain-containing protein [Desulfobulbaceae bacterium]|jgi:hypothetical protein|nr:DUF4209 domain-containing protein [Desulfobulbaceae bacterium]
MANERYPADTTIDKSDFDKEHCQRILDDSTGDGYTSIYDAFSKAARKSLDDGNPKQAKIYWLLSDACSMMLSSDNKNEPFKPFAVFHDRRSAIADDFSAEDISFFSEIITEVTDVRLKARLADLAWLKASKKDLSNALVAIDAYRQIPLDTETWVRDGRECWYRALSLAAMIRTGAGNRIQEMERDIQQAFDSSKESDGYLALWLADLMANFGLGKSNAGDIAGKLESLARTFEGDGDLHRARDYFENSSKWYESVGDKTKSIEMTICHAEAFVKEALARTATEQPSNMVAASFYEKAIQILRTIPKTDRPALKVDERIAELHKSLNEAGQLSLNEMGVISSDGIDITQIVEAAKTAVSEKTPIDALKAFANLSQGMRISEMQDSAIKQLKQHPLSSLFGGTYMSRDGRVIAKTNGINFDETLDGNHPNVQASVMQNHGIHLTLIVQGNVLPALEILHLEHRIREVDFFSIVKQSPIVPPGREVLFAKGLYSGYDHDYVTALHLLSPQIENLVRYHLKNAGAKTSTIDSCGIENENGLSTLVSLPEMKAVFGDDLTFEIKALFCDPLGANLRNELAHGLIDHNACNSFHGVYAWWLILKLVFNTFWNAARQEREPENTEGEAE